MQHQARFQQEPRDPGVRKLIRYRKNNNKIFEENRLKKFPVRKLPQNSLVAAKFDGVLVLVRSLTWLNQLVGRRETDSNDSTRLPSDLTV